MRFAQPLRGAAEGLFEYAQTVPVIDTHEHVPRSEKDYNDVTIRFGDLLTPYVSNDLHSAGMAFPKDAAPTFHCIEDDWDAFAPYWHACKFGSYARPLRIALRHFYGDDDFTRDNYVEIVGRINANNVPGIFRRVFNETCGIERAVRCAGDLPDADDPILVGNITIPATLSVQKAGIDQMVDDVGAEPVGSLDDLMAVADAWMVLQVKRGAIQFKTVAAPIEHPDRAAAAEVLRRVLSGEALPNDVLGPLMVYVREANARKAAELGVPVAIHTGVWGDFRTLAVQDIIGFVLRNPDTRMDIYHLGIPDVRACLQIVKNFPNAFLNLCWAHVVASDMVVRTMKEAIDMLPLNKVFAFGADYILFIEKVYGHLWMARENIALVLGDRVDRDLMDMDEAKQTLRAWFYDNPKAFYGL